MDDIDYKAIVRSATTACGFRNDILSPGEAAEVVAAYREQMGARGVVEVPRQPLVRVLDRLDDDTMNTAEYDALVNVLYPGDLVVRFPPVDAT